MLRDDINNAVKDAMRARDERKLSTLRMVNSTIKNADIDARGQGPSRPLPDADLLGVFQKMIKQRQESVELYDKGAAAPELRRAGARGDRESFSALSCRSRCRRDDVKAGELSAAVGREPAAAGNERTWAR